jgi:hypothetical protein
MLSAIDRNHCPPSPEYADFRSTPVNGHRQSRSACLKSAKLRSRRVSLNHLVGAGKQRPRHLEAKRAGGLQVEDKIELDRLLDREIARFDAL